MGLPAGVKGYECRHVVRVESTKNDVDEALYVKRIAHMEDGTLKPEIKLIKNFERDVYITKPEFRTHKDIRTAEQRRRLQKLRTTERGMVKKITRALRMPLNKRTTMREVSRSPYVYGTDISSATIVKHGYMERFKDCVSKSSLAVLDIETDVVHGHGEILSVSLTMGERALLVINKKFMPPGSEKAIRDATEKYIPETLKARNIDLKIIFEDTPALCCVTAIQHAHEWMPDFIGIWNIDFDLPKIIAALKKENFDLAAIFSDPKLPREYRHFYYDQASATRVSSSGRRMNLSPHELWHTVVAPSSFYWIDMMATYAFIRKAKGMIPSYALDYVMSIELKDTRKLKFDVADEYSGLAWHVFMQENYKAEYMVYNLFDTIGCEILDEKTKDIQITLPELSGISEYRTFSSTPSQLADDLHFYFLEQKDRVIASKGKMDSELDEYVIGREGHIITLPTHLVEDNGLAILEDFPKIRSLFRGNVSDLDIKSAYPYGQIIMNMSRETKRSEVCGIEGVTEEDWRIIGLNIAAGPINATEFCQRIYKTPSFVDVLEMRLEDDAA